MTCSASRASSMCRGATGGRSCRRSATASGRISTAPGCRARGRRAGSAGSRARRVARARRVVARLLGGSAYWRYGVERLVETCREHGVPLALLPGDDKPDPELARDSTVPQAACRRLWRYLAEGGPGNADNFLRYAASLVDQSAAWAEPAPLLRAGLYWPGRAMPGLDDIAAERRGTGGRWSTRLPSRPGAT